MLDNAAYHRSKFMRDKLATLKVPLMFMGPYQFKMAPIELFFSYIKSKDLNPLKSNLTSK
jgi:transposase